MRWLIVLLVGLGVGVMCTAMAMNALSRTTAYPRSVMVVIGQQFKALDKSVKQNRCATTDVTPRLQTLRYVANDIEPAFESLQGDAQFGRYAGDLRAAADAALMTPPASCAAAVAALNRIDKACDSCHRDYRN